MIKKSLKAGVVVQLLEKFVASQIMAGGFIMTDL